MFEINCHYIIHDVKNKSEGVMNCE